MQGSSAADCWDALDLESSDPPVVAIVGGGGKTTLLYLLGLEAAVRDRRAVLTGTTRFTADRRHGPAKLLEHCCGEPLPDALRRIWAGSVTIPITVTGGEEPQGRYAPIRPEEVDEIARMPELGLLAVEADGSKMRPFKAPANHEPVIPASTTHVVAVVGLDALDAPLDAAHVHRPERVRALLGDVERLDAAGIARVLASAEGGRKGVAGRSFSVLLNKADLDAASAERLARAILEAGVPRVVIASLRDGDHPVRAVLT